MSERDVFTVAREITDPAARCAYLDGACGTDTGLRSRVEALLRAHDRPDSLLDHPAVAPPDAEHGATQAFSGTPNRGVAAGQTTGGDNGAADDEALTFLAPPTRPDALGRLGHYEVLQVLGKGGFGIVFRAFDEVLQRVVALKVLAPAIAATSPARRRFLREARSSAQVRHENVVQVYEVAEQPLPYLAMEFIPGETLQQKLDRVGPLDVSETVHIGRQIAEGLAAAHATDLIHRDIKPGNVLLEGGHHKVKITDFGLARAADDSSISQSGIIAGTPMYMAPEQAEGKTLDQRADLFSLGSVLYQMVAGRPPFRANSTVAVLKRVAEDQPRAIREIIPETPQWLCDIIAKLHAKNPDDRYQSARELADVLADCEAQLKVSSRLKDYSRIPRRKPQRSGRRKWVAVALAALLLAFAGSWFGRAALLYFSPRGELELLPQAGLVSVIVLQNNEGVLDGDKLHAPVTDWLDMKKSHLLNLAPGRYQLNVGTFPAGTAVSQWEVTTSGPFGSNEVAVPVINTSAIITVERGCRVSLRAKMRTDRPHASPVPLTNTSFDAKQAHEASAKRLGIPVETTNSIGLNLRFIPAGKFTMGSPKEEIDRCLKQPGPYKGNLPTEGPEHSVEITRPFYLGATEVTVGQFRQFVDEEAYQVGDRRWRNPEFDQTDEHPVVYVSWHNAVDFCKWLSKKEGKEYRLPTEAEWEYSCRAGKAGSRYGFGDDDAQLKDHAWFDQNSGGGTHPVGKKKPNAWGLYDMHGNAWEWCQDNYDPHYYKNSPVKDPPGGAGGARAGRGGGWLHGPVLCRSACRGYLSPDDHIGAGFRVLLVSPAGGVGTESGAKDKPAAPAIAPFTDADVQRIAALPAALQVEEVRNELLRRNPGFDGKMETKIEDGVVTEFRIVTDQVTDIAPIRVFNSLRVLDLGGTHTNYHPNGQLADLSPLQGMNLTELTKLNLDWTKVGDVGLVHFKDCTNLTYLGLGVTRVSDSGLAYFKNCKSLTALELSFIPASDVGLAYFKDCKDLTRLHLAGTQLSDVGLAYFKDCKNLTLLDLNSTKVSDAGLVHFKGCTTLENLSLPHTAVTDVGLAHFKDCKQLMWLYIRFTKISDLSLLKGMPLKELDCDFRPERDAEILRSIKTLERINGKPAAEFWQRYSADRPGA